MTKFDALREQHPHLNIVMDRPLSYYSYTQTGGPADAIVFPKTIDEIQQIINWVQARPCPLTVLGNLSNLIVRDGGIEGLVMILTDMTAISRPEEGTLYAESGATLKDLTRRAQDEALTGLEFACGIPGSVGGAIFMNAGAYGGEVCEVIEYVDVMDQQGHLKRVKLEDCDFAYRASRFQKSGEIVLGAAFKLEKGNPQRIQEEMDRLTILRESKQPLEYPSCGSVFKRPEGHFTGQLIQEAGLQGHRIGGAEVSRKHAGFIVNVDHATASDYVTMIKFIQAKIWDQFQVRLEPEVRIIGREPKAD